MATNNFELQLIESTASSVVTTVNLIQTSSNVTIPGVHLENDGFSVSPPKKKQIWGENSAFVHGGRLLLNRYENREITVVVSSYGVSPTDVIDQISQIEHLIDVAILRSTMKQGNKCLLRYTAAGGTSANYLEVIDGSVEWPDIYSVEQIHQRNGAGLYVIQNIVIRLTTSPFSTILNPAYLEFDPVLTTEPSTYEDEVVYNHGEFAAENSVALRSSLGGSFPASLYLRIKANLPAATSVTFPEFWVGVKYKYPNVQTHWDYTDASYIRGDGGASTARVANDYCTGNGLLYGNYFPVTFVWDGVTTEKIGVTFPVTASSADITRGVFRVVARSQNGWNTGMSYKISISYNSVEAFSTDWVAGHAGASLDFGTIVLPPGNIDSVDPAAYDISIVARRDTSSSALAIWMDYLYLFPIDGGFRIYKPSFSTVVHGEAIIDTGWGTPPYVLTAAGYSEPGVQALLPPLEISPGGSTGLSNSYLIFVHTPMFDSVVNEQNDMTFLVTVGYVPKYNLGAF